MLRRPVYLPVAGLVLFVVFALARLPLSLVLDLSGAQSRGMAWTAVSGTLWSGTVADLSVDGYRIGTVSQRTRFVPFLAGRAVSDVSVSGGPVTGEARLARAGDRITISDGGFLVDLAAYGIVDAFGAPMRGVMRLETDRLQIAGGQCGSGTARLWTDTLTYSARAWGGQGFPLAGTASCGEDGVFDLDLGGRDEGVSVSLTGRLEPDLDFLAEVTAEGLEDEVASGLMLYGFERNGDTLTLIQRGNLLVAP